MAPTWTTACPDWADRLRRGASIIPPPIFPEEAEAGLAVFKDLRIVDAPGCPRVGDAGGQWAFDLAASIFGAYDAQSGRRLIREWFVLLPKKNWKSGLAASIMVTCLIRNWRRSAEFTILAPTIEVAGNSFGPARDMVEYEDEDDEEGNPLKDLIHPQPHLKTLTHLDMGATLKVIAADANTAAGKKSVGTLVDELWLFGKRPDAGKLLREATGGMASRPEGFVIYLTTQSDEPPAGVFKEKLQYARDVRDGKIRDPKFVPILYEHPPEMVKAKQHLLLGNLPMVNPNLGRSVDEEYLQDEFVKARHEGEHSLMQFLAKHGNVELGLNLRSDRWAGADFWLPAADETLTLDALLARSEVVTVGIDGGGLDDLLGLAVLGRERGTRRWLHWGKAWAHEIALDRRKDNAEQLEDYRKAGHLTVVKLPGEDIEELAAIVCRIRDMGLLPEKFAVGVDDAGIKDIIKALMAPEHGITYEQIARVRQGYSLNGTIKTTERALAGGTLVHGGQPIMAWAVGNARIEDRGNAILVTKAASGKAKIDPVMALFDAVEMMALEPVAAASIDDFLSHTLSA
ncbi:Phage terminase, large subunit [plant metagenome]|uniref:Phage terminase, large subunit n=1 Tax=plant metagenome TaxID=1297885 RepID=A0A484VEA7_9ZZZZ